MHRLSNVHSELVVDQGLGRGGAGRRVAGFVGDFTTDPLLEPVTQAGVAPRGGQQLLPLVGHL